jgi:glycyl-tRNA synthetase
MKPIYNINGLVHWQQSEITSRERMQAKFAEDVSGWLRGVNAAWRMDRVEAPIMIPRSLINANYTNDDLWVFHQHDAHEPELVARPETTPSTYAWMVDQLQGHNGVKLPWCVWQSGKSFRAEQDQVLKHMRLKEFYQMEFQCAYSTDTAMDYHGACVEPMRKMLGSAVGLPTRIVESDRLPSYSLSTLDVEVNTGERWMEICSISKRTDFPIKNKYQTKNKEWKETDILVLEIAIGLDRCVNARGIADSLV